MPGRRAVLGVALFLAACSGDVSWFGGDDGVARPGGGVAVMLLERQLPADPSLADLPIRLPPPVVNPEWPQSGGVPSHVMHHLAANDDLKLVWSADIGSGSPGESLLLARPAVADGRVYTLDAEGLISAFKA